MPKNRSWTYLACCMCLWIVMGMVAVAFMCVSLLCLPKYAYCGTESQEVLHETGEPYNPLPIPFEFAFHSNDGQGTTQHRRESGTAEGAVKGAYGYVDPSGVYRAVEYVADTDGFRAVVRTNEPGTAGQNTANVQWIVQPPPNNLVPTQGVQPPSEEVPIRLMIQPSNFTPEVSSSASNILYSPQQISQTLLQSPFPVLTQSNGIVTVQLPPTRLSAKRTVKLTPRSID